MCYQAFSFLARNDALKDRHRGEQSGVPYTGGSPKPTPHSLVPCSLGRLRHHHERLDLHRHRGCCQRRWGTVARGPAHTFRQPRSSEAALRLPRDAAPGLPPESDAPFGRARERRRPGHVRRARSLAGVQRDRPRARSGQLCVWVPCRPLSCALLSASSMLRPFRSPSPFLTRFVVVATTDNLRYHCCRLSHMRVVATLRRRRRVVLGVFCHRRVRGRSLRVLGRRRHILGGGHGQLLHRIGVRLLGRVHGRYAERRAQLDDGHGRRRRHGRRLRRRERQRRGGLPRLRARAVHAYRRRRDGRVPGRLLARLPRRHVRRRVLECRLPAQVLQSCAPF